MLISIYGTAPRETTKAIRGITFHGLASGGLRVIHSDKLIHLEALKHISVIHPHADPRQPFFPSLVDTRCSSVSMSVDFSLQTDT